MTLLVLGGARSGKSGYAQRLAERSGLVPMFLATAEAWDDEMRARIALHVSARGPAWVTGEAPFDLPHSLMAMAQPGRIVLVDCLTLWLSNVMLRGDDIDAAEAELTDKIRDLAGPAILVSNEVGSGIVPDTALGRRFRDAQGRLNQAVAAACDAVVLVTAGLPCRLKPATDPGFEWGRR